MPRRKPAPQPEPVPCLACKGSGTVSVRVRVGRRHRHVGNQDGLCLTCWGTGQITPDPESPNS